AKVYAGAKALTPEDIAEAAYWIATLPPHININHLEIMPTCQAWGNLLIKRDGN
ncbi:MAG: NADP-dependent 3-hydroxy acid dehydrogenase, partial [Candidatus Accumulibacter sp.]|nr:NADP-dependent 3-hydroxy acid dehydrogenase [Accumulibacter sp.]